jgi:hypothetical protein
MGADYTDRILASRRLDAESLRDNERSWLALIGLFPLADGINTLGSDASNRIVLPGLPRNTGTLNVSAGALRLNASQSTAFTINGTAQTQADLRADRSGDPTFVEIGNFILLVIERGGQPYLRVWDKAHPARKNFIGLNHYPIDPAYCITARFIRYEDPRPIEIEDIIHTRSLIDHVGAVEFDWQGQACRLEAQSDDEGLYFNFRDRTNGDTTYPAGRFLLSEAPQGDRVIVDFNLAYNPPCAFTDFATCPLPPPQNKLPVRIEAGEMKYRT